MLDIRRFAAEDASALLPLIEAYWRFERIEGFDADRIRALLTGLLADPARGAIWVACVDGRVSAYLLLVFVFSLEHQGLTAEIDELYVSPAQRGNGLGAGLLAAAEHQCRRIGCTSLALQLARDNGAARAFYRGRQFQARDGYELLDKRLQPASEDG